MPPWWVDRAKRRRGKPVLINILAFSLVFKPYLLNAVVLVKSQHYLHCIFLALVAPRLLVSLNSRLVACSARIVVHTHTHTHTQTKYSNPRCACTPRVNKNVYKVHRGLWSLVFALVVQTVQYPVAMFHVPIIMVSQFHWVIKYSNRTHIVSPQPHPLALWWTTNSHRLWILWIYKNLKITMCIHI